MLKSLTVCLGGMSMRDLARMVRVCGTALSELRACPLRLPGTGSDYRFLLIRTTHTIVNPETSHSAEAETRVVARWTLTLFTDVGRTRGHGDPAGGGDRDAGGGALPVYARARAHRPHTAAHTPRGCPSLRLTLGDSLTFMIM